MAGYSLRGRIRDSQREAIEGLHVLAFDDDPLLNPDDFLGEDRTDSKGDFEIQFDESRFKGFWEFLEGMPEVYLVLRDEEGKELLRTRVMRTGKEIEYQVRQVEHAPDADAPDVYAGNARRIINMLGEVGSLLTEENSINLDLLANGDLPEEIRQRLRSLVDGFGERLDNFYQLNALLSGLVNEVLEERRLGSIGYDGPQVPRLPRRVPHNQVIIWPRGEKFRWE